MTTRLDLVPLSWVSSPWCCGVVALFVAACSGTSAVAISPTSMDAAMTNGSGDGPNSPDASGLFPDIDSGVATPGSPTAPTDDGGTSDGSCGGALVCENFEDFALGAVPDSGTIWNVVAADCSGTGTLAIDDSQSYGGTRSLKVTGEAGYCNHIFLGTTLVTEVTGDLWGRFYVRLSTALDSDHASLFEMHDETSNSDLRMGGQDEVLMWNRESDDATLPAMSPAGTAMSVVPTASAWHCVEFVVGASPATLETWVDGAPVVGLSLGDAGDATADSQWLSDTSWEPHLVDARFGWESYAGETETLWFDDIALGASRIGCGGG